MSLARGKFGIEYNPQHINNNSQGAVGWIIAIVALTALVSLAWTLVARIRSSREETLGTEPEKVQQETQKPIAEEATHEDVQVVVPPLPPERVTLSKRPTNVRNLLLRLEEAERKRNLEMAVETIEQLRSLPGSPAADLDDALARRLGMLNIRWLFDKKNAQWVKRIVVKRGDSASRIAAENGSSMASLIRLNGGNVDKIIVGASLYVMDHPRFNMVIHRRTRTVDLSLNGKFFKRYDLLGEVVANEGAYELPERKRQFWATIGAKFRDSDRKELDTLLPTGINVLVSDL